MDDLDATVAGVLFLRWGYLVRREESGVDESVEDLSSRFAVTDAPTHPGRDRARPSINKRKKREPRKRGG